MARYEHRGTSTASRLGIPGLCVVNMKLRLRKKLEPFKKDAWIPETVDGNGPASASKFSGIAYIPTGEIWPACENCGNSMQLLVQVNSRDVPDGARDLLPSGILQLFYCTNLEQQCDVEMQGWLPFSKASVARIIEPSVSPIEYVSSPVKDDFPAKIIRDWQRLSDHPNWEELGEMGLELSDEEAEEVEETDELAPASGEKLGGWPAWVQGVEYPQCPECGNPMSLLFQVDSKRNIPFLFGDLGCGHITQCPHHRHVVAFGWACR